MDSVVTRGSLAKAGFADAALAIVGHGARSRRIACGTIRPAAIDPRLSTVRHGIHARGNRARAARTDTTCALCIKRAGFPVRTGKTRAAAIDIGFAIVLRAVAAFGADTLIHLAHEPAGAPLHALDTRDTRAAGIANPLGTGRRNAERALSHGFMGQYGVGTNVGGAVFGIVVRIVCRNLADIEGHVALTFDAIAIQLRRQGRSRGLQTFANAFAIFTSGFAAEVRGTIVFAIGGHRAFRRHSAAAARAAARAAIAGITARTAGSTARTAARLLLWFGIIAASGELNPDEAQSGGNQPSSFQFHDKYSSRAAHGAANGSPTNV